MLLCQLSQSVPHGPSLGDSWEVAVAGGRSSVVPVGVSGMCCSMGLMYLENRRSPQPILVSALHGAVLKLVPAL